MRRLSLWTGMLLLAGLWLGPLPGMARTAFWAHMTMHMGVVAVAAPLLVLGLRGGALDPVMRAPRFMVPIPAAIFELAVVWAWHAPGLHHLARTRSSGLLIEQALFLLAGLMVWGAAFGGSAAGRAERAASGVVALLLTAMHMTLLGALLALTPRPLYHGAPAGAHGGGLSPLDDQQLGGALMLLVGGASYLAGGVALAARVLRAKANDESSSSLLERPAWSPPGRVEDGRSSEVRP